MQEVIELVNKFFPDRDEVQKQMLVKYAEVHAKYETKLQQDESLLPLCLFTLNELFEKIPTLCIYPKTYKGYSETSVKIQVDATDIKELAHVIGSDGVVSQFNSMIQNLVVEEIQLKIKDSAENCLGYGNKPLINSISMIAEKTMPPALITKLNYSIK